MMQTILENLMESMEEIKENQSAAIEGIDDILQLMKKDSAYQLDPIDNPEKIIESKMISIVDEKKRS